MILFKNILKEEYAKVLRSEDAESIFRNNCKNYDFKKSLTLYRRDGHSANFLLVNPIDEERKTTDRLFPRKLIEALPSWSKYPKRSNSISCASEQERIYESEFANHDTPSFYVVVPFDNAIIGVTPYSDFNADWKEINALRRDDAINAIYTYCCCVISTDDKGVVSLPLKKVSIDEALKIIQGPIDLNAMRNMVPYSFEPLGFSVKYDWSQQDKTSTCIIENTDGKQTLFEKLNDYLNPEKNGFVLTRYDSTISCPNQEIWTSSPCLLVNIELWDSWLI